MILYDFWIFSFDISSLIAFVVGIFVGFVILCLVYLILVLSSLRKKKHIVKTDVVVTDEELAMIYKNSITAFKDKTLKGPNALIGHCFNVSSDMVKDIARKYYPKSKYPLAELSVDEILMLTKYISDRINELVDRPVLRLLKKVKLTYILSLYDTKKKIDDSAIVKVTKKYKVKRIFKSVIGALNVLNPIYWVRKLVIDKTLDAAMKKLCNVIIGIVYEETVKIYSKRVFDEEKIVSANIDKYIYEIDAEMKDVTEEEIDAYLNNEIIDEKEGSKDDK